MGARLILINIAYAMRGQVNLAILMIGKFEFPDPVLAVVALPSYSISYPSYSPTLSWTKSSTSSGR